MLSLQLQQPISGIGIISQNNKCSRKSFIWRTHAVPSRTQRIMESVSVSGGEVGGAGGTYSYEALKRLDQLWSNICLDHQQGTFISFNHFHFVSSFSRFCEGTMKTKILFIGNKMKIT
ncbi:hypothetical protein Lalb_Chr04g0249911 [Lupinus albus]|uniref:Uncharacterized protein n=1 Tax=Lupinus albus TaxID=3870 RepID=A0A6A4QNA7_LUPAL|nr:hypothetical protein Lalb_Chr04g0249911 [Lupinus albus]